jgi:hypothetical protein
MGKAASGLGMSLGVSVGVNLYDYGVGKNADQGIGSKEFFASTAVDFAQAGLTGLAAAGVVAGGIALAGIAGISLVASTPLWLAGLATAGIGYGISQLIDNKVDTNKIKEDVAKGFETFPGIVENGKTILTVGSERVKDAVANKVSDTAASLRDAAQETIDTAAHAVRGAANKVKGFFGGLFGGD